MPLDIVSFREYQGGNPEVIRESQRRRHKPVEIVDEIIEKDGQWRKYTGNHRCLSFLTSHVNNHIHTYSNTSFAIIYR